PLGANRPAWWLGLAPGAGGLLAAQMVLDLSGPAGPRLWRRVVPIALCYLAAVGWAAVQAGPAPVAGWAHPAWAEAGIVPGAISADPAMTWHGVLRLLGYGAIFWVAARGGADEGRARLFVAGFAAFSVALALYGLVALYAGENPITGPSAYPGVVTASFVNRNAYAYYAGLGLMATIATLAFLVPPGRTGRGWRQTLRDMIEALGDGAWAPVFGIGVLLVALVQTESRAGTAASLGGAGVLAAILLAQRGRTMRRLGIGLLGVAAVVVSLTGQRLGDRLGADPLEDQRADLFVHVIEGIAASPWLGHGLGAFQDAFRTYMTSDFSRADWAQAHNSYLENAFELGLPAAGALYLGLAILALSLGRGVARRQRLRALPALGLCALGAGALHATVDFSLQMPASAAALAFLTGIGWSQSHMARQGARSAVTAPRPEHASSRHRARGPD
ncbi:MAG: O-antigen ligase family protein, partial [Thermohalobaculum sp.]|nr:O-antigen ligase family protein [Thermohalobaculum sp.]